MLRQQRNRFRTTQRNNRRSPVRGKDRGTRSIRRYTKGEIPRGEVWPRSCETCCRAQAASIEPHEPFRPPPKVATCTSHGRPVQAEGSRRAESGICDVRNRACNVARHISRISYIYFFLCPRRRIDPYLKICLRSLVRRCSQGIVWNFPRELP